MSDIGNITVNNNECTPFSEAYLGPGEDKILSFEPGMPNFYVTVDVYGDPNISEEEREYVRQSLTDAAQFVSGAAGDLFALQPLYGRLKVIYRPQCLTVPQAKKGYIEMKAGEAGGDTVILRPLNLFDEGKCTYETRKVLDPGEFVSLASIAAHEMLHTYFFPRLGADPARIVEEGIISSAQFMYGDEYGGFAYKPSVAVNFKNETAAYLKDRNPILHQQFGASPAVPISSHPFEDELNIQAAGKDGLMRDVAVVRDGAAGFRVSVDGEEKGVIAAGEYAVSGEFGYAIAVGESNGGYNLYILDPDDEVRRVSSAGNALPAGSVEFGEYGMIWAEDGAGGTEVFIRAPIKLFSVDYSFDQHAKNAGGPNNYLASFIMHTELERLYWRVHSHEPGFHPSDYYKRLGDLHGKYRAYLFNDPSVSEDGGRYYNGETNIYHEICEGMSLPEDECLDIFRGFGLDVDYFDPAAGENICLPDNDKEPEKGGATVITTPLPDDEGEAPETGYSGSSGGGCHASPASAAFGLSVDRAIAGALKEAAEEYGYLWHITRLGLERLLF